MSKQCFVIAPIGTEGQKIWKRSNFVLEEIIQKALAREPLDYIATRGDEIQEMGEITAQVLRRIVHDPLVVADLTGGNPNVFYELAFRHILGRPVIQIQDNEDKKEYHNVRGVRTIRVDHRTPDGIEKAIQKIHAQAKHAETAGGPIDTGLRLADEELAVVLASIPALLQPERAEGPDVQDLESISRQVGKARRQLRALASKLSGDPPDLESVSERVAKVRMTIEPVASDLKNLADFYGS